MRFVSLGKLDLNANDTFSNWNGGLSKYVLGDIAGQSCCPAEERVSTFLLLSYCYLVHLLAIFALSF